MNNNKLPKVLLTLSSILANLTYLMAFPFYALKTVSCTYFLLFLVPFLGTVRFSEPAQPTRVQVRTLLHVTVELAIKQVTNSGSFRRNDNFFLVFLSQVEDILKIISHKPIAGFLNSVFDSFKGKTTVIVNLRRSYIETLWRDLPKLENK